MKLAGECLKQAEEYMAGKEIICFIGMADWDGQKDALEEDYVVVGRCPVKLTHPGYHRPLRMYFIKEKGRREKKEAF